MATDWMFFNLNNNAPEFGSQWTAFNCNDLQDMVRGLNTDDDDNYRKEYYDLCGLQGSIGLTDPETDPQLMTAYEGCKKVLDSNNELVDGPCVYEDCEGSWSECEISSSGGYQTYISTYSVSRTRKGWGKKCPYNDNETRNCYTGEDKNNKPYLEDACTQEGNIWFSESEVCLNSEPDTSFSNEPACIDAGKIWYENKCFSEHIIEGINENIPYTDANNPRIQSKITDDPDWRITLNETPYEPELQLTRDEIYRWWTWSGTTGVSRGAWASGSAPNWTPDRWTWSNTKDIVDPYSLFNERGYRTAGAIANCATDQYYESSTGNCIDCHHSCATCIGPDDVSESGLEENRTSPALLCTRCADNRTPNGDNWKSPGVGQCFGRSRADGAYSLEAQAREWLSQNPKMSSFTCGEFTGSEGDIYNDDCTDDPEWRYSDRFGSFSCEEVIDPNFSNIHVCNEDQTNWAVDERTGVHAAEACKRSCAIYCSGEGAEVCDWNAKRTSCFHATTPDGTPCIDDPDWHYSETYRGATTLTSCKDFVSPNWWGTNTPGAVCTPDNEAWARSEGVTAAEACRESCAALGQNECIYRLKPLHWGWNSSELYCRIPPENSTISGDELPIDACNLSCQQTVDDDCTNDKKCSDESRLWYVVGEEHIVEEACINDPACKGYDYNGINVNESMSVVQPRENLNNRCMDIEQNCNTEDNCRTANERLNCKATCWDIADQEERDNWECWSTGGWLCSGVSESNPSTSLNRKYCDNNNPDLELPSIRISHNASVDNLSTEKLTFQIPEKFNETFLNNRPDDENQRKITIPINRTDRGDFIISPTIGAINSEINNFPLQERLNIYNEYGDLFDGVDIKENTGWGSGVETVQDSNGNFFPTFQEMMVYESPASQLFKKFFKTMDIDIPAPESHTGTVNQAGYVRRFTNENIPSHIRQDDFLEVTLDSTWKGDLVAVKRMIGEYFEIPGVTCGGEPIYKKKLNSVNYDDYEDDTNVYIYVEKINFPDSTSTVQSVGHLGEKEKKRWNVVIGAPPGELNTNPVDVEDIYNINRDGGSDGNIDYCNSLYTRQGFLPPGRQADRITDFRNVGIAFSFYEEDTEIPSFEFNGTTIKTNYNDDISNMSGTWISYNNEDLLMAREHGYKVPLLFNNIRNWEIKDDSTNLNYARGSEFCCTMSEPANDCNSCKIDASVNAGRGGIYGQANQSESECTALRGELSSEPIGFWCNKYIGPADYQQLRDETEPGGIQGFEDYQRAVQWDELITAIDTDNVNAHWKRDGSWFPYYQKTIYDNWMDAYQYGPNGDGAFKGVFFNLTIEKPRSERFYSSKCTPDNNGSELCPCELNNNDCLLNENLDCIGSWSQCTVNCEQGSDRTWEQIREAIGNGDCPSSSPSPDCGIGDGECIIGCPDGASRPPGSENIAEACTCNDGYSGTLQLNSDGTGFLVDNDTCTLDVNCEGSWSGCTADCETAQQRMWNETQGRSGQGSPCPPAIDCELGDGGCPITKLDPINIDDIVLSDERNLRDSGSGAFSIANPLYNFYYPNQSDINFYIEDISSTSEQMEQYIKHDVYVQLGDYAKNIYEISSLEALSIPLIIPKAYTTEGNNWQNKIGGQDSNFRSIITIDNADGDEYTSSANQLTITSGFAQSLIDDWDHRQGVYSTKIIIKIAGNINVAAPSGSGTDSRIKIGTFFIPTDLDDAENSIYSGILTGQTNSGSGDNSGEDDYKIKFSINLI
tara:strand:- start:194 stop:5386 length:5193 start_codon:yes stop_codon:yes gene_type:complete